jgi:predicted small secreted protein
MKRQIAVIVCLLLIAILAGCTNVTVDKPDGTKVTILTLGSSQVSDMTYERTADGIILSIGATSNTPDGIPETIEATGKAILDATTAGVSSAGSEVIKAITATDPSD